MASYFRFSTTPLVYTKRRRVESVSFASAPTGLVGHGHLQSQRERKERFEKRTRCQEAADWPKQLMRNKLRINKAYVIVDSKRKHLSPVIG